MVEPTRGMSKRRLVRSALGLVGLAAAAGCGLGGTGSSVGSGQANTGKPAGKLTGTVHLLHTNEASNERMYRTMADTYNARGGPKVELLIANGANQSEYTAAVTASWASGLPPDLFHSWYQWLPGFIGQGIASPIDDLIARDKWNKEQIIPSAYDITAWQGKHYGLAHSIGALFMYYNLDLMTQNGLDTKSFPTAWSQWDELSPKLTKRMQGEKGETFDYISLYPPNRSDAWYIWPQTNGGKLISPDGRKALFNEENVIQTAEWA